MERSSSRRGYAPCVKVLDGLSECDAFDAEIAWIAALGRAPFGPLVNGTAGGPMPPSNTGRQHSVETREKMRRKALGRVPSDRCIEAVRRASTGRVHSEETKAKRKASLWKVQRTAAWYEKVSFTLKGRKPSAATSAGKAAFDAARKEQSKKRCGACGGEFYPKRRLQAFCGKRCSGRFSAAVRNGTGSYGHRRQHGQAHTSG